MFHIAGGILLATLAMYLLGIVHEIFFSGPTWTEDEIKAIREAVEREAP